MKRAKELIEALEASTDLFIKEIRTFKENELNIKPEPNAWSAGDVAEHIVILESLINNILSGTCVPAERNPEEKVLLVKNAFSDFSRTFHAPEPIAPSVNSKTMDHLINVIRASRQNTVQIIAAQDPGSLCKDFVHRIFGEMTRSEWVHFCLFHTDRHIVQIQKIKEKIIRESF